MREEVLKGSGQKPQRTKYTVFSFIQDTGGPHPTHFKSIISTGCCWLCPHLSIYSCSFLSSTFMIFKIQLIQNFSSVTSFHHFQSHLCHSFLICNWMSVSFIWGLNCAVNSMTGLWGYVWLPSQILNWERRKHFSVFFLQSLHF